MVTIKDELSSTTYPGRGIIAGLSADGKYAVSAYWTMGRSAGSRNRIFVTENEDGSEVVRTKAFDETLIAGDPSLIIYAAVRELGKKTIVTNGDQTDTINDGLKAGLTFEQSLRSRKYEHDAPNYTPRISSLLDLEGEHPGTDCFRGSRKEIFIVALAYMVDAGRKEHIVQGRDDAAAGIYHDDIIEPGLVPAAVYASVVIRYLEIVHDSNASAHAPSRGTPSNGTAPASTRIL